MFDAVSIFFQRFVQNVRIVDFLDVFIVSIFLFLFFTWLKQSASKRILISIVIILSFYGLSHLFELYLTELLIRVFMIIALIASIIVFQSDIRRMVDLIGMWDIFRNNRRAPKSSSRTIDILTESLSRMAEKKTGALIAVKGREIWDRPIHGGIELNGFISPPLLYSIFSTSSPGHDGAVLLEEDRILKFGCHLTLSTNLKELKNVGTRHAAGLGLSEQCDALVLIVSEERGTISVAQKGTLHVVTAGQLKEKLEEHWEKHYSNKKADIRASIRRSSIRTAFASIGITALLWFLLAYQSDVVYRSYMVPVEWKNLQGNLEIVENDPREARITLTGSEQAFRNLDPSALAISLDLQRLKKGNNKFLVAADNLVLPGDLKLYSVEPQVIKLKAEQMNSMRAAVRVQTIGSLPARYSMKYISVMPQSIVLRTPESYGSGTDIVLTEPVNLGAITSPVTTIKTRLIPPANSKLPPFQDPEVEVRVVVKKIH